MCTHAYPERKIKKREGIKEAAGGKGEAPVLLTRTRPESPQLCVKCQIGHKGPDGYLNPNRPL